MTNEKDPKVLTSEELETASKAVNMLNDLIDTHAVNLTTKEKRKLTLVGKFSQGFVERTFIYAKEYPELVASFINMDAFEKNLQLFNQLKNLSLQLGPVMEKISNTYMAAGSEAFTAARNVYKLIKTATNSDTPGIDFIVADLKKLYKRPKKKKNRKKTKSSEGSSPKR